MKNSSINYFKYYYLSINYYNKDVSRLKNIKTEKYRNMLLLIIYIFMVDNKTGLDLFLFILNILFNKNKCLNVTIALHGTIVQ